MKLQAVFTEQSMNEAKKGKFTFWVAPSMTKSEIKHAITAAFGVHVVSVATINSKKSVKRSIYGKFRTIKAVKKAIVTLKKGESIDLFEQKEEKKKKAKKTK